MGGTNFTTINLYIVCIAIKKEQKQVSIKIFLKIKLADVYRDGSMNALADKVHKQEVPCTQ